MNDTTARQADFRALADLCWQAVAARVDRRTGRRVPVPPYQPVTGDRSDARFGSDFPVLAHLDAALDLARGAGLDGLVTRLASLAPVLPWSQNPRYTEQTVERAFLDGYAYAGLSGPDAPVRCEAPRGGFMLIGPHVTYADHRHAPEEVYLVMTPGAEWRLDGDAWFAVEPGELVFHGAWQRHATRTHGQPFLAFAGWMAPGNRDEIEIGG